MRCVPQSLKGSPDGLSVSCSLDNVFPTVFPFFLAHLLPPSPCFLGLPLWLTICMQILVPVSVCGETQPKSVPAKSYMVTVTSFVGLLGEIAFAVFWRRAWPASSMQNNSHSNSRKNAERPPLYPSRHPRSHFPFLPAAASLPTL